MNKKIKTYTILLALSLLELLGCDSKQQTLPQSEREPQDIYKSVGPLDSSRTVGQSIFSTDASASLINPEYISKDEAKKFLTPNDIVFIVRSKESTYVFPRIVMTPHHIINERIDGKPIMISYCMLSECATMYSRKVGDKELTFDWLRSFNNGSMVMGDFQTKSHWVQFVGESINGPLKGQRLKSLGNIDRLKWKEAEKLPNLKVLDHILEIDHTRRFISNLEGENLGLKALSRVTKVDSRHQPYDRGLGISVRGTSTFFRLKDLNPMGIKQASVGGWSILIIPNPISETAKIYRRLFKGKILNFKRENNELKDIETGSTWNLKGECIKGTLAGGKLEQPKYTHSWWFAWSAFHPSTTIQP